MIGHSSSRARLWLDVWPNRLSPLVDLICVPGAGAGASVYKTWHRNLLGFIAVHVGQLPGRENRIDEAAASDLDDVVGQLSSSYLSTRANARPLILFGHSMGGVIAFELACNLKQNGVEPIAIVLAASTPPRPVATTVKLSDEALKEMLLAYDAGNNSVVENHELFSSLAPVLHSDFQLLRSHVIAQEKRLSGVEVHLAGGAEDSIVPRELVAAWAKHFDAPVHHHEFGGGHQFPFREAQMETVKLLNRLARQALKQE